MRFNFPIFQDTMMIACFNGMSFDKNVWPDSDANLECSKFRPERFIKDGKICVPEGHNPFGVGKHRCMGELMARANIFLFTTTLLQHFNFLVPPGHPLPTDGSLKLIFFLVFIRMKSILIFISNQHFQFLLTVPPQAFSNTRHSLSNDEIKKIMISIHRLAHELKFSIKCITSSQINHPKNLRGLV